MARSKSILIIGASNSSRSINRRLAIWAGESIAAFPSHVLDLNEFEMPIFSVDREKAGGVPQAAVEFRSHLHEAKGIILSLAEHNGSYSVAFKNVVDWASRLDGKLWPQSPMLLLSTSPGGRGAKTVLEAAKAYFPRAGAQIVGSFSLPRFRENFQDEQGIVDPELAAQFHKELQSFQDALTCPT